MLDLEGVRYAGVDERIQEEGFGDFQGPMLDSEVWEEITQIKTYRKIAIANIQALLPSPAST